MIRALFYLQSRSLVNRLRSRLRRLKQPRYLIGGLVGALYFYGFFFRNFLHGRVGGPDGPVGPGGAPWTGMTAEWATLAELVGAWLLLLMLAAFWVVPSRRAALDFSEAEIQFLFPAPVSRRSLIHYKLLGWQMGLLFTSLVVSVFSGRLFRPEGAWMAILGWWLVLLFIQLHAVGASFARTLLLDRGQPRWPRRIAWAGLAVVALGTLLARYRDEIPAFPADWDAEELRAWFEAWSASRPLAWFLVPLRWVAALALTRDAGAFAASAPPVLVLVALQYLWVIRANVAFEEAAVDSARAAADRLAAGRSGVPARSRRGRDSARGLRTEPFRLEPIGPPWLALGWKNLISAGSLFRGAALRRVLAALIPLLVVAGILGRGKTWTMVVGSMALLLLGLSVIVGPGTARYDLRLDLPSAGEVLKALPLPGWQVVLGELFAPWVVLGVAQGILALVCFALLPAESQLVGSGWGTRLILMGATMLVAPAVTLIGLCLQNAAALIFPAWVLTAPGQPRGGFEAMGQQIIVFAGQMLAFVVALLPPALAGGVAFGLLAWGVGPWAAVLPAAAVVAGILAAEAAVAVAALGRLWDRLDLARELGA